ncbi:MAG: hypothetical protein ACK4GN_17720 [Runella sp.]
MNRKTFQMKERQSLASLVQSGKVRAIAETNRVLFGGDKDFDPFRSCYGIKVALPQ